MSLSLATPTTVPGMRGGCLRTTVPSADGSSPGSGDAALVRHALVSGDDDDFAARELVLDAHRPHFDDARVGVPVVGDDARLAAGETDRIAAHLADRHR